MTGQVPDIGTASTPAANLLDPFGSHTSGGGPRPSEDHGPPDGPPKRTRKRSKKRGGANRETGAGAGAGDGATPAGGGGDGTQNAPGTGNSRRARRRNNARSRNANPKPDNGNVQPRITSWSPEGEPTTIDLPVPSTQAVLQRAVRYAKQGRVRDLELDETAMRARVQGSKRGTYRVEVLLTRPNWRYSCTCPFSQSHRQVACKHVVATILVATGSDDAAAASDVPAPLDPALLARITAAITTAPPDPEVIVRRAAAAFHPPERAPRTGERRPRSRRGGRNAARSGGSPKPPAASSSSESSPPSAATPSAS